MVLVEVLVEVLVVVVMMIGGSVNEGDGICALTVLLNCNFVKFVS